MRIWELLKAWRCPTCMRMVGFKSRKTLELIAEKKAYIDEKYELVRKMCELLDREKEAILGKDGSEVKRDVLLRSMQMKWEAEKKLIDSKRYDILSKVKDVKISMDARVKELMGIISSIKGKPKTTSNHDLLLRNQGALDEIMSLIEKVDSYGK